MISAKVSCAVCPTPVWALSRTERAKGAVPDGSTGCMATRFSRERRRVYVSNRSSRVTGSRWCYRENVSMIPLPPAPGADEHVSLALLGSRVTLPGGRVVDELDSPEAATLWLVERDLAPEGTELLEYCQGRLTELRATLRALFSAQAEALARVPSAPLLRYDGDRGLHRVPAHPLTKLVEHAMAQIAADAAALLTGEAADAVARCAASPCDRFLLRTHARRHWCSTRCGDR